MLNKLLGTVLAALLIIVAVPGFAQALYPAPAQQQEKAGPGVPELRQQANQAFSAGDYPSFRNAMIRLHEMRPNNSEYMYQLVLAHALLGEKTLAFNLMLTMQRQGLSYDFLQSEESASLRGVQLFDHLNGLMIDAGKPSGNASEVTRLPVEMVLPEAITWDAVRQAFLIGTVRDGTIVEVSRDGETRELFRADSTNRIWGIFDLAIDQSRNRLWASTASNQQFSAYDPVDKGRSAVLEFELDSMELIKRYPVPVDGYPHSLGNMALAPSGDLYIADSIVPFVFVKKAGEQKLKPYYGSKNLVSLRGIDISEDGRFLYVADYELGIVAIDLEEGKPYKLRIPETLNLGGIDGLNFWQGHLVIIQNGISPQRIMRLELDEQRTGVSAVAPIIVALDIMDYPNYGTVIDDELYFFANSHWGSGSEERKPVTIASTSISNIAELVNPETERFMEQYEKAKAEGRVNPAPGSVKPADTQDNSETEKNDKPG